MLNPFFLQGSKGEQGLVQDLINEQLKIYGVDVYYLPREYATEKTVIKEVVESKFSNAYPLEAYVDTYDGYGGQGTLLSKFGIQEVDDLTLIISKERYENYIQPLIEDIPNTKLTTRPKEGDLIYFPLGDRIFEIKYVEHEKPFYQLKKNYVYELRCELFRYQDEDIDTDIEFIDDNTSDIGYIQTLQLIGLGSTASAITSIVNGGVQYVQVTNRGTSYTSTPTVSFSRAPSGGTTAVGVATMINNIIDFCNVDPTDKRVQGVEIINPGSGYIEPPMVAFTGGGGSGAEATAYIGDGIVGVITVTDGGSGYLSNPTVTISSPTGVGTTAVATASAYTNSAGIVTSIRITNAGLGYTEAPTITFSSPDSVTGVGTYVYNETITGSESNTTAIVKSWNVVTKVLEVSNITGTFTSGEELTGSESGAVYTLKTQNTDNLEDSNDSDNKYGKYEDNYNIENEADAVIDFTETNPFGTP